MTDEILEGVLDEFKQLAQIPRPSKHEEKVSAYLYKHLLTFGFDVTQDKHKNIIVEVPASEGKENAPLTILQAHMDMVCVAEKNVDFDPLTSPIKLLRDEKFLTAESTSLGADDGIGIAIILFITKNFFEGKFEEIPHGPLRLIFTTDEESGMSGAINLHKSHIDDAQFMLNCDHQNFNEVVVGSAGHLYTEFTRKIKFFDAEIFSSAANSVTSLKIKVAGLRGGHSGIEIDDNRANAIKILAKVLREINLRGNIRLANIFGGTATNVIPSSSDATILTDLSLDEVKNISEKISAQIKKIFIGEENLTIDVEEVEMPEKVFSAEDFKSLINLLTLIHSGVYEMSATLPKTVISSANLGMIRTDDKISVNLMPRSNVDELFAEIETLNRTVAELTNFEVRFREPTSAWNFNPDGKLAQIAAEIFERQNNFPAQVRIFHAGLECSHFIEKNPALDIISIGTTNEFIHSPKERLHLDTVTPQVNLIVETLRKISDLK